MSANVKVVNSTAELERLLSDLTKILEQERTSLLSPDVNHLTMLVTRKNSLLQAISNIHPELYSRLLTPLESDHEYEALAQINRLITSCKHFNTENGALVAQGLKVCRNSIGLLNGHTHNSSVQTYDINGQTDFEPGKRDHGIA